LAEDELLTMVAGNTGVPLRLLRVALRQDRAYPAAITGALSAFPDQHPRIQPGQVIFLSSR